MTNSASAPIMGKDKSGPSVSAGNSKLKQSPMQQQIDITETGNYIVIPPDGGWGWVIVLSAFLTFTFTDGLSYCFGLFMEDIAEEMMVSVTMVSITSSLLTAEVYLMGPIFCAMINRYGFRLVGMIGGTGTCATVLASTFAPNFPVFVLVLGAVGGVFLSMCYISSCIIVGFYFEKWRAIATAISVSGSAAGVIVVPLMLSGMQDFTWRQQLRVLGGILSITILAALTYKPIKPVLVVDDAVAKENTKLEEKLQILQRIDDNNPDSEDFEFATTLTSDGDNRLYRMNNLRYPTAADMHGGGTIVLSHTSPTEYRMTKSMGQSLVSEFNRIDDDAPVRKKKFRLHFNCCDKKLERQKTTLYIATRPLYREDIFFHGPLSRLEKYKTAMAHNEEEPGTALPNYHMEVTRVTDFQDYLDQDSTKCLCCPNAVVRILSTMFDMNLLRNYSFTTFMFSGFFTAAGMFVPYIYVTDMNIAAGNGSTESRSLLSIIGFTNIIGRIMCGLVSVSPKIRAIIVMETCLIISGLVIIVMPFFRHILVQYVLGSLFGLTIGFTNTKLTLRGVTLRSVFAAVNGALRPIVIVDLYGLENLTNAFGIAIMFQGVACTIGIPVAGVLKDVTGSYHALMIFAGSCLTLSGLLILAVQPLMIREKNAAYAKKFHNVIHEQTESSDLTPTSTRRRFSLFRHQSDASMRQII